MPDAAQLPCRCLLLSFLCLSASASCGQDECDAGSTDSVSALLQSKVLVHHDQSSEDLQSILLRQRGETYSQAFVSLISSAATSIPTLPYKEYKMWWLGVVLCSLGCLSSALGLLLMRVSGQTESQLWFFYRKKWFCGFLLLVVNASVLDMLAYSLMPLALMAPFSGLTIVFATLLAQTGCIQAKEEITRSQWMSIAIVTIGVAAISVCGPRTSQELTRESMSMHLGSLQFDVFAGFGIAALVASTVLWLCQKQPTLLSVVVFAVGAATAGAMSQISLKIVSNALREYTTGKTVFFTPPLCIGLGGLVAFAPPQLFLLNSALANSGVAFAVSMYQTLLILVTIVAGYAFFNEFDYISFNWMVVFSAGVTLAISGLIGLAIDTKEAKGSP